MISTTAWSSFLFVYSAHATGIYLTNSPDACHYVANHGQCQIIVVDDDTQLNKILSIRDRLPHLKAIIQYRGEQSGMKIDGVYSVGLTLDIPLCSLLFAKHLAETSAYLASATAVIDRQ